MSEPMEYSIAIVQLDAEDGGGYFGFVPDLPGCMSDGDTREEALKNTEEALREWLEVQLDRGAAIPEPGSAAKEAQEREQKLLDAIKALAEYRNEADGKIADLERQLAELIAMLRDNSGNIPPRFKIPSGAKSRLTKLTH